MRHYLSIADLYPPERHGGSERVIDELSRALRTLGHRPGILAGGSSWQYPDSQDPIPEWRYPVALSPLPLLAITTYLRLRHLDALPIPVRDGVVLLHHAISGWTASSTGHLKNRQTVSFFYGPVDEEWLLQWRGTTKDLTRRTVSPLLAAVFPPLLRAMQRASLRRASKVVVLGSYSKKQVQHLLGTRSPEIVVMRPGVDLERFHPPSDKRSAKTDVCIEPDRPVLLTVRRLVPRMGLDTLLDMLLMVAATHPRILLVIVGQGVLAGRLQSRADAAGLASNLRLTGFVPENDLPKYYRAADVFVLPSTALEGFGLVSLEALASGVPVLATNIGETPLLLGEANEITRIVAPHSPETMAAACIDLLAMCQDLPEACRAFACGFSWENMASALDALVQDLT